MVPLDLHVLGTPPAFVLSQDQTLHYREHLTALVVAGTIRRWLDLQNADQ